MSSPSVSLSRSLRSPALAVALLLAIAVLAAVGTVSVPPAGGESPLARIVGLHNTFQSPLFLTLVTLAAVNVVACTWHRLAPRLRRQGVGLRAATDLVLHGSLLLILVGGIVKGLFGFIGTQNVYVGEGTETVYDWRARRDEPLGFSIRAEELLETFYPLQARIGVRRAATGEKLGVLDAAEDEEAGLPGEVLRMRVTGYDPAAAVMRFRVRARGPEREFILATRAGDAASARAGEFDLTLIAFRADLKDVRARVVVHEAGAPVVTGWLTTNSRILHRGASLFLTAWGADPEGKRYCGIQVVRDPGAAFFWAGCVLLALAIPGHFWVKYRRDS